ncbi:MAG TPA: DsbA family protein [Steroidobacteraceae bacterium]|jgi:protein-disulfide isomerase|nr:DsbA family protein [Steroidobacteraceae bacterium]
MPSNYAARGDRKRVVTALLAVGWLGLLSTTGLADSGVPPPSDQAIPSHAADLWQDPQSPVLGNPQGDVTIVEFFDYACPYCKALEPRLEYAVRSDPHVRLILKEFPILTPESLVASRAALAAAKQHKYRQFHDALMAYRGTWQESVIYDTARQVGLDMPRLRRDMSSAAVTSEIIANFNLARGLRIFQTPGFVAGDHILTGPSAQIDFPAVIAAVREQHR